MCKILIISILLVTSLVQSIQLNFDNKSYCHLKLFMPLVCILFYCEMIVCVFNRIILFNCSSKYYDCPETTLRFPLNLILRLGLTVASMCIGICECTVRFLYKKQGYPISFSLLGQPLLIILFFENY